MIPPIEALDDPDLIARFKFFKDGILWYEVGHLEKFCEENGGGVCQGWFKFPVPTAEVGDLCLTNEIVATALDKWIRKHLDERKQEEKHNSPSG